MSDATRRSIDEEQQFIADQAHRRALELVAQNRALLESFASTLLENEVLEREDIERLVSEYRGGDQNGRPAAAPAGGDRPRLAASERADPTAG